MVRYISLIAGLLLFLLPIPLKALKTVSVMILPFEVNSMEDRDYLGLEIPGVIQNHLRQEGSVDVKIASDITARELKQTLSIQKIRQMGVANGVDYTIWGSVTWIGDKYSLDVKLLDVIGNNITGVFSIQGRGVETFPVKIKELAREISIKLFKREKVAKVIIDGNKRIEADAIRRVIKTRPGNIYLVKSLSEDLKAIYKMGYFEDVRIESEDDPDGKVIVFKVKEKSTIRFIRITGNSVYNNQQIRENLTVKTGAILNVFKIQKNIRIIEDLYKDKNYHNILVTYKINERSANQADLVFVIEEGNKVRIKDIRFIGNQAFTDKELKKIIKSSEKGFFFWITSSGNLNRDDLKDDVARIAEFYHNSGYIRAKVGEPIIKIEEEWIDITIKISEGDRFKVGTVDIVGDFIQSKDVLYKKLKIKNEEYFSRMVIRNDVLFLMDLHSNQGYAHSRVSPRVDENMEEKVVNITYVIQKGKQVFFEEIIISGNSRTRDKVIRRQLKIYEQGLYSGSRLKRSIRKLHRLGYFKDIQVNDVPGSSEDKMVLKIDVTEQPTGAFSIGGGYSEVKKSYMLLKVQDRNLFGLGHIIDLKAEVGSKATKYSLSYTEPWLFDIPLRSGISVYDWENEYDEYDKDSVGVKISFGYPIFDWTRLSVFGVHDEARLDITDEDDAPVSIVKLAEDFENEDIVTNKVGMSVNYDSRNRRFCPTRGSHHNFSVEYSGFGGDIGFRRYTAETGWYFPVYKDLIGFAHARGGFVKQNSDGILPDYELFFLGGINSLRGFKTRYLSLKDSEGNDIGGDKFILFNFELVFPIIKDAGINGVVFFDTGSVKDHDGEPGDRSFKWDDMRESAGGGIRWNSPVGALRLEYGRILDRREDEHKGRWEFSVGGAF